MTVLNRIILALIITFFLVSTTYADWSWNPCSDPTPFYYQTKGKWYYLSGRKVFMVQLADRTYKYVFDGSDFLIGGWVTDMPMSLP